MLSEQLLEEVTVNLMTMAVTSLPDDVISALERAEKNEDNPVAQTQLEAILRDVKIAQQKGLPLCQDTGVPLFFVSGGVKQPLEAMLRRGVERATEQIPLRPNVVHPLTRENGGNNLGENMPHVHYSPTEDDFIEITALPKGAGSENMSTLEMLNPADGTEGVKELVLNAMVSAGGKACPPNIIGVGIGGSADVATLLAKEAIMVPLDVKNPEPRLEQLEEELECALNGLGIGPMGMGGRTTVLGVKVKTAHCHTASLPVAVNFQCWAARRASARIYPDGTVVYSREGFS